MTTENAPLPGTTSKKYLYNTVLIDLCYLLSWVDGVITDKEKEAGLAMASHEGIPESIYDQRIKQLSDSDKDFVLEKALSGIKKLDRDSQINIIAWVTLIANTDGFMAEEEWLFIYRIYCTELKLDLKDILARQKELNKMAFNKDISSMGVRMNR
jgi:uncharacterized tellurite resistance protein B-like protein